MTKLAAILLGAALALCMSPIVAADDDDAKPEATQVRPAAEKDDGKKAAGPAAVGPAVCVAREVNRSVSYRPTLKDKWQALEGFITSHWSALHF